MADDLFNAIRNQKNYSPDRSVKWYRKKISELGGRSISASKSLQSQDRLTSQLELGRMYLFKYDPKYKATLPMYDMFPLIIPFNRDSTSFTALNFHYLPYGARIFLLRKLSTFAESYDNSIRLRLSWQLLSNYSKFPEVSSCVKKYLYTHVQTRFMYLDPSEWNTAVLLPYEKFVYKQ